MEFKVVKEFGSAKKGDILKEDNNLFCFDVTEGSTNRAMAMDINSASNLVDKGYLEAIEDATADDKLEKVRNTISTLITEYETANNEIAEAYENKEIPTCVKVEADTVYYNMNKILKKIKDIIDE